MFTNFYIFYQNQAFQKLRKMVFISSKKLFSLSRLLAFCIFSLPFHYFQIQKVRIDLHKLANVIYTWNNSETTLHWIIKIAKESLNKEFFEICLATQRETGN